LANILYFNDILSSTDEEEQQGFTHFLLVLLLCSYDAMKTDSKGNK